MPQQIRPLANEDYTRGFIELLSILTECRDPGHEAFVRQLDFMRSCPDTYYTLVIFSKSDPHKVIATGQLLLERKFIHGLTIYGHIEDIAVSKDVQGKGLGKKLILALTALSESLGAFKTLLDCSKDNIREFRNSPSLRVNQAHDTLSLLREVWVRDGHFEKEARLRLCLGSSIKSTRWLVAFGPLGSP
jgi:GNAT superfamily N-acetyltransferase